MMQSNLSLASMAGSGWYFLSVCVFEIHVLMNLCDRGGECKVSMTHTCRVIMATFMGSNPGWNITEFPFSSPLMDLYHVRSLMTEDGGLVCCLWRKEVEKCKTCVCHAGSFLALTRVSTTWGWWDIYRACGVWGGVRPAGGPACILHACAGTSVFLACDVLRGSIRMSKYFPSWFSVSSFLEIVHRILSVMDEKVLSE